MSFAAPSVCWRSHLLSSSCSRRSANDSWQNHRRVGSLHWARCRGLPALSRMRGAAGQRSVAAPKHGQIYFCRDQYDVLFSMNAVKTVAYGAMGQFSKSSLQISLWLVPVLVAGIGLGLVLHRRCSPGWSMGSFALPGSSCSRTAVGSSGRMFYL